ncbi:MAG: Y-family DNA polymerase [Burkholderiaceae bacterium]|nr:MAG: Y-family DNA polymerase [Burkholderiaceae bacterium]TBR76663.1 MAG: Y-family DNA polymerase [Burkholderiaceae bacterium]
MYALVDGNNFYSSCEIVFRPSLLGVPLIVASNNDGCAISRSDEAKSLGIKMGQPLFEVRRQFPDAGVVIVSANFALYGDISNRMMGIAAGLGPQQEIYSIDECFSSLAGMSGDLSQRARRMRERILQWIGIPTGIGIGPTKTLAKLANHVAKSAARKPGSYPGEFAHVCNLAALPSSDFEALLDATDLGEIWGIGPRIGAQLRGEGLNTALDVVRMDPAMVRRRWSVVLERTVRELQGQPCIALEDAPPPKREIACTRSFGHPVTALEPMLQAVSEFAALAGKKLRSQGSRAGQMLVFAHTSPFRPGRSYSKAVTLALRRPSSSTLDLVATAARGMRTIYRPGVQFMKAGIMLLDLVPEGCQQGELALDSDAQASGRLMSAVDAINDRYGRGAIRVASAGVQARVREWEMRQEMRTPDYTTRWKDLPVARA